MNDFSDMFDSMRKMCGDNSDIPEYNYTPLDPDCVAAIKAVSTNYEEGKRFGGFYYRADFSNGYGISIVKHNGSYGHENDQWEIAVMKDGECCYTTPITDDVIGWLSEDMVMMYVMSIRTLSKVL